MGAPFTFKFPTDISDQLNVSDLLSSDCKYNLHYAQAQLTSSPQISLIQQFYNGHSFYLELISYKVKQSLCLKIIAKKPYLSFVFVSKGDINFKLPGAKETIIISPGQYFAHYIPAGEYLWPLTPGQTEVLYFVLRSSWLLNMSKDYPGLTAAIKKLRSGYIDQQVFERHRMTDVTERQLEKLRNCKHRKKADLEEALLHAIKKLVNAYHTNLTSPTRIPYQSNKEIAYSVRDHIIAEVRSGLIPNVAAISEHFNMEQKSLRRGCLRTFKLNLKDLITTVQMEIACGLLINDRLKVKEVAARLGYSEAATFTRKFKKYYGYLPGSVRNGQVNFVRNDQFS